MRVPLEVWSGTLGFLVVLFLLLTLGVLFFPPFDVLAAIVLFQVPSDTLCHLVVHILWDICHVQVVLFSFLMVLLCVVGVAVLRFGICPDVPGVLVSIVDPFGVPVILLVIHRIYLVVLLLWVSPGVPIFPTCQVFVIPLSFSVVPLGVPHMLVHTLVFSLRLVTWVHHQWAASHIIWIHYPVSSLPRVILLIGWIFSCYQGFRCLTMVGELVLGDKLPS